MAPMSENRNRGVGYWSLVILSFIGCVAGVFLLGYPRITRGFMIEPLFSWSLAFALFCVLFEIETLVSASKLGIPDEDDKCKSVSYVLSVILTIEFPAIVVLQILRYNLNFPAVFLCMLLSYSIFAAVWFFMLWPYGYNGMNNILLSKSPSRGRHRVKNGRLPDDATDSLLSSDDPKGKA